MRAWLVSMVLLLAVGPAGAKEEGVDSPSYFAPIGCGVGPDGGPDGCHDTSADAAVTVQLDGAAVIPTGGSADYMVSLPVGFGGQMGSGVNVAVGTDSTASCDLDKLGAANLNFVGGDATRQATLSHADATKPAPAGSLGVWSYSFALTNCIIPGTIHLVTAMNAYNGDADITGDLWNRVEMNVTVPEPTANSVGAVAIAALGGLVRRRRQGIDCEDPRGTE
jgi:MYXO-CTERM domain-containing protein